jgi:hypothetical protein
VFDGAYAIALAEVREDYAKVTFPDRWPLSQAVDDLLNATYWAQ